MSSIRPLVTIAILIVVGVFLYVKINQGPVGPVPGVNDLSPSETTHDAPPLAANRGGPSASANTAPLWPNTAAPSASTTVPPQTGSTSAEHAMAPPLADVTTAGTDDAPSSSPAVPAIPELPAVPATADATPPVATTIDLSGAAASQASTQAANPPSTTQDSSGLGVGLTPESANASGAMANDAPSESALSASATSPASPQNPLRQTAPPTSEADRYAASVYAQQSTGGAGAPVEGSFADSWPVIQTALDRGELARAHQLLSQWYDEPSLTPAEAEKVATLLSQLAGTVVYSTQHQLEPPRVVKPGETLETIAKEFNVPWQLLAKINGIPAADQVRPGQELKVVPGPFSAVVDLGRSQLTLLVDGRYAGKFRVTVPVGATVSEGQWLVDQKLVAPAADVTQTAYTARATRVDHAILLRGASNAGPTAAGPTIAIASSSTPTGSNTSAAAIQVSAADAEELSDILSIGSRVVIRR